MVNTLEELTDREVILGVILLNTGNPNFRVEDLKKGLDASPRPISWNSLSNTFFFYNEYLTGELNLPHYRLSTEGKKIIKNQFDTYSSGLQQNLKDIAEKVWNY